MDGVCSAYGDNTNAYKLRFCWESRQHRGHLRNPAVNGSVREYYIKMENKQIKLGYMNWIFYEF